MLLHGCKVHASRVLDRSPITAVMNGILIPSVISVRDVGIGGVLLEQSLLQLDLLLAGTPLVVHRWYHDAGSQRMLRSILLLPCLRTTWLGSIR